MTTVYEAKPRVGGRIHSVTGPVGAGLTVELGAEFINTDHEDVLALTDEFGIALYSRADEAERSPYPTTAFIYNGERLTIEAMVEAFTPIATQILDDLDRLDEDWDFYAPLLDRLSVRDYLDLHGDRLIEPYVRYFLESGIRSEYGVEPEYSSALQLLYNLPTPTDDGLNPMGNSDEAYTVEGGTERIIVTLRDRLADQIQLNKRLVQLRAIGEEFRLTFADASAVVADIVIVALPFTALRDVQLQAALPPNFRQFITEGNLGLNEKVIVGVTQRPWRQPDGFIGEIWTDLGFTQAWDATQRQFDRTNGALTLFLSANQVDETEAAPAAPLADRFMGQLADYVDGLDAVRSDRTVRTYWYNDYLVQGSYASYSPGQYTDFGEYFYIDSDDPNERQTAAFGSLIFAGEHLSDAYYGYMNGAAETGRLAAEEVLRQVRPRSTGQADLLR
jgi:monoamine oxidase